MKKNSLKSRILAYLEKHGGWVASGQIQRLAQAHGYASPSNASRRCRELVEEGKLEVDYRKNHAWYKAKSSKRKIDYYITNPDGTKELVGSKYE